MAHKITPSREDVEQAKFADAFGSILAVTRDMEAHRRLQLAALLVAATLDEARGDRLSSIPQVVNMILDAPDTPTLRAVGWHGTRKKDFDA